MGFWIIRFLVRVFFVLLAVAVVRRSVVAVGGPSLPGGRARLLPWFGITLGVLVILRLLRI